MERLHQIAESIETWGKAYSPGEILSCATQIYISEQIGAVGSPKAAPSDDLASPKQKSFLKQLGYKGDVDIVTKKEASKAIEELK